MLTATQYALQWWLVDRAQATRSRHRPKRRTGMPSNIKSKPASARTKARNALKARVKAVAEGAKPVILPDDGDTATPEEISPANARDWLGTARNLQGAGMVVQRECKDLLGGPTRPGPYAHFKWRAVEHADHYRAESYDPNETEVVRQQEPQAEQAATPIA